MPSVMKTTMIDPDDIADYPFDEALLAATLADGKSRLEAYRLPATVVVLGRGERSRGKNFIGNAAREDGVPIFVEEVADVRWCSIAGQSLSPPA